MTDYPVLADQPTLAELQAFVADVGEYRGFDKETLQEEFTMLVEEVGELAKALRKHHGTTVATDSKVGQPAHEVADIFWMLLCVCNRLGIDLETALRAKNDMNKQRVWR